MTTIDADGVVRAKEKPEVVVVLIAYGVLRKPPTVSSRFIQERFICPSRKDRLSLPAWLAQRQPQLRASSSRRASLRASRRLRLPALAG
jgi:hypothetical protein